MTGRGRATRARQIQALLADHNEVSVGHLAERLSVTSSTIRRDLAKLTRDGNVTRTYGGAVISTARAPETTLYQRAHHAPAAKNAIGHWAANEIQSGETVILDAGTTVARVAHHLRGRDRLAVITNGLTSVNELADTDDITVTVLAGELRHVSQSFVGPLTDMTLSRLSATRAFLGADGLVAGRGICEASVTQTRTKEMMMERARHVYVLADSSKLGLEDFGAWAPLHAPWTLVTDDSATEQQLEPFRQLGYVNTIVVPVATTLRSQQTSV